MHIRHYQPGDEQVQAELFNQATRSLPAYKPATAEDIAKRYRSPGADPTMRFYAIENSKVIGYIVFHPNGRISYPWCWPDALAARLPLLDAALGAMKERGMREAWACYRADWTEPLGFLEEHGFELKREMVNYVAELSRLPALAASKAFTVGPFDRDAVRRLPLLAGNLFEPEDGAALETFLLHNDYFRPDAGFVVKDASGATRGAALAIVDGRFADPTKIDPAMPCFRLGAFGTESERHKRVNGLFSCVFEDEAAGEALLAEAVRRFQSSNLLHAAAQAPSDQPRLIAFYDRFFQRQGAFPILATSLTI